MSLYMGFVRPGADRTDVLCLGMGKRSTWRRNFKAAKIPAVVPVGAGLSTPLRNLLNHTDLFPLWSMFWVWAPPLAFQGYLRVSGRASAPAGMLVCLYLAALLICRFRDWSKDPLLGDYCFELFACVFAMLAAYQLAGFPLGRGRRRRRLFFAPWRLCISAAFRNADAGWTDRLFFAAMALWQFTGVCSLEKPVHRRRKLGGGFEETDPPASEEEST